MSTVRSVLKTRLRALCLFISTCVNCLSTLIHTTVKLSEQLSRAFGFFVLTLLFSTQLSADGGDFSQDFTASAPLTYNHAIGGGAFDDRTVGRGDDIVESLEGGDFACGDIVTFLTQVVVDDAPTDPVQTIELDYSFTAHSTGQQGTALADIVNVAVNYGVIDMGAGDGAGGTDSGINDDGNSVATLTSKSLTGPLFVKGTELLGTVRVTDLETDEQVVVRVDVMIDCLPNSNPTGNMQGKLAAARVTEPAEDAISGGAQTIPFKKVGQIEQPQIDIIKTVTLSTDNCPGVDSLLVNFDQTAKYCYEVINSAQTAPLLNLVVTDDNGTPGDTGDDFTVTLTTGLSDEDNDNQNDDLAAGSSAFGEALRPMTIGDIGSTIINTATADADEVDPVTDIAQVQVPTPTLNPNINIKKEVSVNGGSTFVDANDAGSAPATLVGGDALYRLTVTNTGDTDLENVVINDANLGIVNFGVGNLSVGQIVVLTESEISALDVPGRCSSTGLVTNTASASGNDVILQIPVNDSDDANVLCVTESIKVLKEISIDNGVTFLDANDAASAPTVAIVGGALYRITVTNTGSATLNNIIVNDGALGIVNANIGTLASGAAFVLTSGSFPVLNQPQRCQVPGNLTNTATASGTSSATSNVVNDSDDAVVKCVAESIKVLKEISIDNGVTYEDANDANSAPAVAIVGGALYRITVTNTGSATLNDVTVNDAALGIVNANIGTLTPNAQFVLTSGSFPVLSQPQRCQSPGLLTNTAIASATVAVTLNTVNDSDDAVILCVEEELTVLKEISVDNGVTYVDANDAGSAPSVAIIGGALYRITVTNTGTATINNVLVNDAELGVSDFAIGTLAPNAQIVLTSGQIAALNQPARCEQPGTLTNTAIAAGTSDETGNPVEASDDAVVLCVEEELTVLKEISVDNGVTYVDANDANSAPAVAIIGGARYRITVTNTGTATLNNVVVNDAELGIVNAAIGNLAPNAQVVLSSGQIPALDQPTRCEQPGTLTNTAIASGTSDATDNPVEASDDAVVLCVEEELIILKEISVDGGITYVDANDAASAPSVAIIGGALYRITVTNTGTATINNVVVNDAELGVVNAAIGHLAPNAQVVLNSGQIPELDQPARCQVPGTLTNTAITSGTSDATGNPVEASDDAVVNCVDEAIELIKEISVDGGITFFDANQSNGAPAAALGDGALYRIKLTNIGTATLMDVLVNDPSLGIVDFPVANLAPNDSIVLTSGDIAALDQPDRCQAPGNVVNIATVDAISSDTGNMLSDSDPAVLRCVEEAIDIIKLVSIDGGANYFDANTGGSAPVSALGSGALYRITVTNTGTAPLENVVVNDATLNIVNYFVGDLAVNQTVILNQGEIPELEQPGLCQVPGDITNIATADGDSVDTGNMVSDSDNANVRCVREEIELVKEVSVDGGNTYFDANQSNGAPALELGGGALYRISLTNNGTVNIVNITVTDATLGIFDVPVSDLAPGQTVILTSGEIPALNQPGRCQTPGDVTNIAIVDGTSEDTGNPVSDSDPAVVRCVEEAIRLLKEVSVDGGNTYFDANDGNTAPMTGLGNGALYRITLTNIGTADLMNVTLNDPTLNIVDVFVGSLLVNQTIVLDEGDIPALGQPDLCEVPGDVVNVATGDAISDETGNPVSDSDTAVVSCEAAAAGVLIIDEDSIDNNMLYWLSGVVPNQNNGIEFRKREVNENRPAEGSRRPLPFFVNRVGQMFKLQTGQVGDEAWFALETIPSSWSNYDAGGDGLRAFVDGNVPQSRLDEIDDVTPLRATGLVGLEGGTYCAVVYDSDVSINYPVEGNLQGENLGIVAFRVEIDGVEKLNGFSSSSLPTVLITVLDPTSVCSGPLTIVDAPEPPSSSEPEDIDPDNLSGGYR